MTTKIDEIAPDIYRLSTLVPDIGPTGFTFNQFLVVDEEPLLFHTGHRSMFPSVRDAIETVLPVQRLRWITFGHVESDECGSMNDFLAAAPDAQVAHGVMGCMVSLNEMADRAPRALGNGEVLVTGAKRFRHIDTPHVPHNWESRVLFEETTRTLFAGDLFTHFGDGPALTESDVVEPAVTAEDMMSASSLSATTPATVAQLAELAPTTMALMHGSSYTGDCAAALNALAADYRRRIAAVG
ncbi:MAG TPA: MBL fold metallo-hydrolase [Mycobacteriales bacterium]|nr:MBL fold metallo-hydrolase [Mycobacteriales bacterium]